MERRGVGLGQLSDHDGGHAEDKAHAHDDEPKRRGSQSLKRIKLLLRKQYWIIYLERFILKETIHEFYTVLIFNQPVLYFWDQKSTNELILLNKVLYIKGLFNKIL